MNAANSRTVAARVPVELYQRLVFAARENSRSLAAEVRAQLAKEG